MQVVTLALSAFAVVVAGMIVLMAVCEGLRRLAMPRRRADAEAVSPALDPRTLAVIAAAVAEALGPRAVIHRVHVHRGVPDRWSRAGRMDIMVSHRVGPSR